MVFKYFNQRKSLSAFLSDLPYIEINVFKICLKVYMQFLPFFYFWKCKLKNKNKKNWTAISHYCIMPLIQQLIVLTSDKVSSREILVSKKWIGLGAMRCLSRGWMDICQRYYNSEFLNCLILIKYYSSESIRTVNKVYYTCFLVALVRLYNPKYVNTNNKIGIVFSNHLSCSCH